ncbi:hypothetical protein ACTHPH_21730 [Paenibacillus pasadenensis]|uniref:hypothetical protein n=1 Tax=Paenibacillus pasadenensis TaxID=217090 RepID=UPI0004100CEE|nr:hypothetical protein [Paenibacillus pasadenensis]
MKLDKSSESSKFFRRWAWKVLLVLVVGLALWIASRFVDYDEWLGNLSQTDGIFAGTAARVKEWGAEKTLAIIGGLVVLVLAIQGSGRGDSKKEN